MSNPVTKPEPRKLPTTTWREMTPPSMWNRMIWTKPGMLSGLIDEIIYGYHEDAMPNVPGAKQGVCPIEVGISQVRGGDGGRHSTGAVLRAVRDYLEACAFKEIGQ